MSDDLHRRLRAAADDFDPDGERMWDRVATGMSGPGPVGARAVRPRRRIPHLAVATGVAVALIGAVVFIGFEPVRSPFTGAQPGADDTAGAVESVSPAPEAVDELVFVDCAGSINDGGNDWWSQSDLTLTVTEPVQELTIELRVVAGDDVESTGSWTTADHYWEQAEVFEDDGFVVFRWTLIEGQTIAPGEYILAGQYNHGDGPRSYEGDYFVLEGTGAAGSGQILGGFVD